MSTTVRVGTRASALALWQTRAIVALLQPRFPDVTFEVVEITTHGDRFRNVPITRMGEHVERGIFNSALEEALLAREVDVATCSFKDVESQLPGGIVAVTSGVRADPRDVLATRHGRPLAGLPRGALLATSSPRRISQLRAFRPDLRFEGLRGNITTRLDRDIQRFDGIVLAGAGVVRLQREADIAEWIDPAVLLPAPAQGALGCEYLAERDDIARMVAAIQDDATETCVRAEKTLLVALSGGCYAPIGALAHRQDGRLHLQGRVVSLDGTQQVDAAHEGDADDPRRVVEAVAQHLLSQGAGEIVARTRHELDAGAGD